MSAYICSADHIKALAIFAAHRRRGGSRNVEPRYLNLDGRTGTRVPISSTYSKGMDGKGEETIATVYADMLYQENIRSVMARYPGDGLDNLPGPADKALHLNVTGNDILALSGIQAVWLLSMCACLEYQSCETEDYERSDAYALLQQIRLAAIRQLPGYENAPWHFTLDGHGPHGIRVCG